MTRFLTQLNNSHLITLPQKEKNKTKQNKTNTQAKRLD